MKEKLKQKVKSYSFWTGLSASIVVLAKSIADIFGADVNEDIITNVIMAICGVLIVLGIVVMPTSKESNELVVKSVEEQERDE